MNVEVQKWPSWSQLQLQRPCFGPQARDDDDDAAAAANDDDDDDDDGSVLSGLLTPDPGNQRN